MATGNRPLIAASQSKGSRLFIVGVDGAKAQITARISRGRSVRFSDTLEARYFEELASERHVIRYLRGVPSKRWERIPGRRAECLDASSYAWAVRGLVTVNLDRRADELATAAAPPPRPSVIRSAWLNPSP